MTTPWHPSQPVPGSCHRGEGPAPRASFPAAFASPQGSLHSFCVVLKLFCLVQKKQELVGMMLKLCATLGKTDAWGIFFSHPGRWYVASVFLGLAFCLLISFFPSLYLSIKFTPEYFIVFVPLVTGLCFFHFCS